MRYPVGDHPVLAMLAWAPPLLLAALLVAATVAPAAAANSCRYAWDAECDEPSIGTGVCAADSDDFDCRGTGRPGLNQCFWAYDGECDDPGTGTGACPAGSDGWDCSQAGEPPHANSCPWAFDGECDEPGVGTGACPSGTDVADCKSPAAVAGGGNNTCQWANDGECDDPDIGTGACAMGTDANDCTALRAGGNDTCQWARDGECDEPGIGLGVCTDGTDVTDCAAVAHLRHRSNNCELAFNDTCNEAEGGDGRCSARSDTVDCIGRDTAPGVRDHYFGRDDRVMIHAAEQGFPWTAVGRLVFSSGGSCSAALAGPRVGVTAAHCFFHEDGRRDEPATFYAGLDGDSFVAQAQVIEWQVAEGYDIQRFDGTNDINGLDYGFFALASPIGEQTGSFRIAALSREDLSAISEGNWFPVHQAGYSWDSADFMTANIGCAVVRAYADNTIHHDCDTTQGDSGSPFFIRRGDGEWYLIAVDSAFEDNPDGPSNYRAVDNRAFADALLGFLGRFR